MAFHMQALVVAPGGMGTCDELFELLTLKQTGKIQKSLPVVLLGKAYWKSVINWQHMGMVRRHPPNRRPLTVCSARPAFSWSPVPVRSLMVSGSLSGGAVRRDQPGGSRRAALH